MRVRHSPRTTITRGRLRIAARVACVPASVPGGSYMLKQSLAEFTKTIRRNKLGPAFLAMGTLWAFIPVVRGPEWTRPVIAISACSISLACLLMTASRYWSTFRWRVDLLVMISINVLIIALMVRE